MVIKSMVVLMGLGVAAVVAPVWAHGAQQKKSGSQKSAVVEQKPFGIAGDASKVARTVKLDMSDEMRFFPALLNVRLGETLRLRVHNNGKQLHELVLGTLSDLEEHAALMKKFPDMEHDEPYMAHVKPGTTEEIVWHFNRAGEFHYACLVAGHFERGMVGKLIVKDR